MKRPKRSIVASAILHTRRFSNFCWILDLKSARPRRSACRGTNHWPLYLYKYLISNNYFSSHEKMLEPRAETVRSQFPPLRHSFIRLTPVPSDLPAWRENAAERRRFLRSGRDRRRAGTVSAPQEPCFARCSLSSRIWQYRSQRLVKCSCCWRQERGRSSRSVSRSAVISTG